jgi:hypothetical protein
MMDIELRTLDGSTLRAMYDKQLRELNNALLNGATWEQLQEQREFVTQLSMALHKTMNSSSSNPAENSSGNTDRLRP